MPVGRVPQGPVIRPAHLGGEALRLATHGDNPDADVDVGELQAEDRLPAHARARLRLRHFAPGLRPAGGDQSSLDKEVLVQVALKAVGAFCASRAELAGGPRDQRGASGDRQSGVEEHRDAGQQLHHCRTVEKECGAHRLGLMQLPLFAPCNNRYRIEIRGHVDDVHTCAIFRVFRDHFCQTLRLPFAEIV